VPQAEPAAVPARVLVLATRQPTKSREVVTCDRLVDAAQLCRLDHVIELVVAPAFLCGHFRQRIIEPFDRQARLADRDHLARVIDAAGGDHANRHAIALVGQPRSPLATRGVELLNGPMNREWGMRTAGFTDPTCGSAGCPASLWEVRMA